jgi:hydroxypyruvate isomerase
MLRISANLGFLWKGLPLLDAVRRAKRAGFDAVEFHAPYEVPVDEMKAVLEETALPVAGINTRPGNVAAGEIGVAAIPGRESEARAAIDEALAYAQAIEAAYVQVTGGKVADEQRGQARKTYLSALDHASGGAEKLGITIVIEALNPYDAPGNFLNSLEQTAGIIGELGRPNVKHLFDCYHVQIIAGDLTRRLERLMPTIGHIQIAAVPSRAEPDEGEISYERLLPTIEKLGYRGYIGAEYRARGEVEAGLGWLRAARPATGSTVGR